MFRECIYHGSISYCVAHSTTHRPFTALFTMEYRRKHTQHNCNNMKMWTYEFLFFAYFVGLFMTFCTAALPHLMCLLVNDGMGIVTRVFFSCVTVVIAFAFSLVWPFIAPSGVWTVVCGAAMIKFIVDALQKRQCDIYLLKN